MLLKRIWKKEEKKMYIKEKKMQTSAWVDHDNDTHSS